MTVGPGSTSGTPGEAPRGRESRTTAWVNSTYFAEGLPYMAVRYMSTVFLTDLGVREAYLGFLNFLGIPWNLKFTWAPIVDLLSTKRRWMLAIQLLIAVALTAIAGLTLWAGPVSAPVVRVVDAIVFIIIGLAFVSATHDVAIDAYYLAAIRNKEDQARYSGDRVMSYRMAVIYAKSLLVAAAAIVGWATSWALAALTMAALFVFHSWYLPEPETPGASVRASVKAFGHQFLIAFRTYLDQPRVALMLIFVTTYKLGDEIMFSMNTPFLLRELGVTKVQLSWLAGILGTVGSIAGSMLAAWYISRVGLKRAIWPLTLLMNVNILAYVALAYWRPSAATPDGIAWIAVIHAYEQWAAGLGNATLVVYLMRTCRPEFKAAHYAVGSAVMSLGGTLLGGFGGLIVEAIGYVWLYLIGFFASIPSMLLIFWIPYLDGKRSGK